jgi:hypothetical protein
MSEPNWGAPTSAPPTGSEEQKPAVPPAEPEPLFVYRQEPVYPVATPQQNWGVNAPAWTYAVIVPRPPRPAVVQTAILLAYIGVVVATAVSASNSVYQWSNRERIFSNVTVNSNNGAEGKSLIDASATLGIVIGSLVWLLVAVGVVVCAVLANRRKNGARITLAAGLAVVGLYNLCGVGSAAVVGSLGDKLAEQSAGSSFSMSLASTEVPWWSIAGQGVLAALALTIFILLILPASNRYFVAGAGRRFAPEA